jgi:hypothetical protein
MTFQRNRYGLEQEQVEISEKDLADKVSTEISERNLTDKVDTKILRKISLLR